MFEKHPEARKNENLRKNSRHSYEIVNVRWLQSISESHVILLLPLELLLIPKNISKIDFSVFRKWSAIDVWDYSFPEAKDQWGCFKLMTYLRQNSCYTIVMNRFREIAYVRLPGNRLGAGSKPSTWLPPEELVEQSRL